MVHGQQRAQRVGVADRRQPPVARPADRASTARTNTSPDPPGFPSARAPAAPTGSADAAPPAHPGSCPRGPRCRQSRRPARAASPDHAPRNRSAPRHQSARRACQSSRCLVGLVPGRSLVARPRRRQGGAGRRVQWQDGQVIATRSSRLCATTRQRAPAIAVTDTRTQSMSRSGSIRSSNDRACKPPASIRRPALPRVHPYRANGPRCGRRPSTFGSPLTRRRAHERTARNIFTWQPARLRSSIAWPACRANRRHRGAHEWVHRRGTAQRAPRSHPRPPGLPRKRYWA